MLTTSHRAVWYVSRGPFSYGKNSAFSKAKNEASSLIHVDVLYHKTLQRFSELIALTVLS
jgi:hypothetical protein